MEKTELPVALEYIHVVELEASKAGFDRIEDVLTDPGVRICLVIDLNLENFTLRERPWRLTYPFASGSLMKPLDSVSPTVKKTCKTKTLSDRNAKVPKGGSPWSG